MTKEEYLNYRRNNKTYEILHAYYLEKTTIPLSIQDFVNCFSIYINLPVFDNGRVYTINPQNIVNNMLLKCTIYYDNKFK